MTSPSRSAAFSLQAAAENPFPTLLEMIRHRSFSYSCIALRSLCNCCVVSECLAGIMPWFVHFMVFSQCSDSAVSSRTISSVHTVVFALSLVQYLTCNVPELLPGKKSAICFQVRSFVSLSSTKSASSSGVNFSLGPFGRGAGSGIPG